MPTVDISQRRSVNPPGAVELQVCRAELQATRLLVAEVTTPSCPASTEGRPKAVEQREAHLAVLTFERGQSRIELTPPALDALRDAGVRAARIDIHAWGDQPQDSPAETALARRRAEAAATVLTQRLGIPAERLRITWTGAGVASLPTEQRRRVEIEFVDRPLPVLLSQAAAPARVSPNPGPTAAAPARSTAASVAPASSAAQRKGAATAPATASASGAAQVKPAATEPPAPATAATPTTTPASSPTPATAARSEPPLALRVRQPN